MILDVFLGGVSGLELCRRIRRDPGLRGVRVVLLTALGTGVEMMLAGGEKADAYLGKPFNASRLVEVVASLVAPP